MVAMLLFYILLLAVIGVQGLGIIRSMLHPWDSWWFIGSYVVICVLAPIINKGIETLTKAQFRNILLSMLFYEYVGRFVGMDNSHDTIFMLTIFLTARYTRIFITPPTSKCQKTEMDRMICALVRSCLVLNPNLVQYGRVGKIE